jgi:formamidopyrimidine-DNA glycosylase
LGMPELPEVEFARRALVRWMKGKRIVKAQADDTRIFRGAERSEFSRLTGTLLDARRKGKYLLLHFSEDRGLLSHLGMTGKYVRSPSEAKIPYSRARFFLTDGTVIHYRDPRLFGRMEPVPAQSLEALPVIAALGVDPWNEGLDARTLKATVADSKQALKVALMDQSRIAGLGNIHAAEALYRAKLHPARKPASLTGPEWSRLAKAIHQSLAYALEVEKGEEIEYVEEGGENPFLVYGRAKERCKRCGGTFKSMVQGGRTTHFCPSCQK